MSSYMATVRSAMCQLEETGTLAGVCHSGNRPPGAAQEKGPSVTTRPALEPKLHQQLYHMERWTPSSRNNPCPICGRTKDGDCRIRGDGQMILCHRGKTLSPPERVRVGEVLADSEGRQWAYTGDTRDDSRDMAVFAIHRSRPAADLLPTCTPPPAPPSEATTKGDLKCIATTYQYNPELRVIRYDYESKKKEFQPQFFFNGHWNIGKGAEIWPFYGSLGYAGETFVLEVEGEKCVDVLRAQGIAAITHPGHQRDEVSCRARYEGLKQANIERVYFIADNDAPGRKKATAFLAAANLAQIELRIIPAESMFDVPEGGSVDDMPADQLSALVSAAITTSSTAKIAPLSRTSYAKIKKALQELHESGLDSAADIQTGIADIASAHDAQAFDVRRIWDSLEEDKAAEVEALSSSVAIIRRQELEEKRRSVALSDYLPEAACSAIEVLTDNLACDPLIAVSVVLTTASGVFRAGHRLDAGDGLFVKEPVIWTLLAGPSGSGKSPIMRHLCRDRLRLVASHYNQLSMDAEIEWEARYGMLPKARRPDKPEPLRTCVSDFTTESLNGIISDNHEKGLPTFIYSEEVKEILGNFDEYKSAGKGRGKEAFLCLFDGNVNAQHRVGRRSKMIVGKVQNALLGGVQPGVLRKMIEEGDDAGLYARCLMVPIVNQYVEPNFFRTPEEIQSVHMAEQALENFYLRCLGLPPLVLRLERDAIDLFVALSKDTYDKTQAVSLESQRAVYGKRLGYVLQVSLAMHLCRVSAGEADPEEPYVSKQTLAKAVKFVDLLQSYAIIEQQESQMQRHGSFDLNRRIHVYAKNNGGCTASDFAANCIPVRYRASIKTTHVKAAMDQLVSMELGEWAEGSGRRPKARFMARGRFPD